MSFKTSDEPGLYLLTLRCDGLQFLFSSKPRQNELSHFHMTSAVCLNMEGRGWVEGVWGQCTLVRPAHNASFSQMGCSQGPAYLLPLPPSQTQLYSLPDPSVWCKWYEGWVQGWVQRQGRLSTTNVFFRNRLLLV